MDANKICSDFIEFLNQSMLKLEEMSERITSLNNQVALKMLQTTLLFDPIILLKIEELDIALTEAEEKLKEGQELKNEFAHTIRPLQPTTTAADYERMIKEIANL